MDFWDPPTNTQIAVMQTMTFEEEGCNLNESFQLGFRMPELTDALGRSYGE